MNSRRIRTATAVLIAAIAGGVVIAPVAAAVNPALNGVFTATSDGFWATSNETRREEATVVSTWTIASSCTGAYDCTGTVSSDHGWSAAIVYISRMWFVTRTLNDWIRCPDGTATPGKQIIKFHEDPDAPGRYAGWDTAAGRSAACGVNRPLFIEMPFTLVPK